MLDADARRALESMMRATEDDATPIIRRLARIQARHILDASAGGDAVPAGEVVAPPGFKLEQAELDDDCGCPEETWGTPYGSLNMHLSAGDPSNAHLDNGDEGEWEVTMTLGTVAEARAAFFGWATGLGVVVKPPAGGDAGEGLTPRAALHAEIRAIVDQALDNSASLYPSKRDTVTDAGGHAGAVEDAVSAVLERWDAHSGDVDERNRLIARLRASFSAEGK